MADKVPERHGRYRLLQIQDSRMVLDELCSAMSWRNGSDVLMDIGCGTGSTTVDVLIPAIPEVMKIIAIDASPDMVDYARTHNIHPKVEYHVADVEDKDSLFEWNGKISKVISLFQFSYAKDQEAAFRNIYSLLDEGGEALVVFPITTPIWDSFEEMLQNTKWTDYYVDIDPYIPETHIRARGTWFYRKVLEDFGFRVITCEDQKRTHVFESDEDVKVFLYTCCGFSINIPDGRKDEFRDELYETFLKYNGRDVNGKPVAQYTTISLHLQRS